MFLASMKEDHPAAAIEIGLARELDPLSILIRVSEGWTLYWARRFESALVHARETIELDANCVRRTHPRTGRDRKRLDGQVIPALEEASRKVADPLSLSWLGMAYGAAGEPEKARAVLRRMEATAAAGYMPSLCLAWVHVGSARTRRRSI